MIHNINLAKILREQSKIKGDIRVAYGWLDSNKKRRTSFWKKISEASDDFLAKSNLRELWQDELVLDYDNQKFNGNCTSKVSEVILALYTEKFSFTCWETHSNGYHFHLEFPEMLNLNEEERKETRRYFIEKYNADPTKISGLISIPETPHWKSKQLMRLAAVV